MNNSLECDFHSPQKNISQCTLGAIHKRLCSELTQYNIATRDASLIIEHVTGLKTQKIIAYPETILSQNHIQAINKLLFRRIQGEPFAYIKGIKEFYGRNFLVGKEVLIPRPETESIIDMVLNVLQSSFAKKETPIILDCGTGSGCIGITIAAECMKNVMPHNVILSDVSKSALSIAKKNISHLLDKPLSLYHSYLLTNKKLYDHFFNIIIANLPYVTLHDYTIMQHSLKHEPSIALIGSTDKTGGYLNLQGLTYIKELLQQLSHYNHSHYVFLEYSPSQCDSICSLAALYEYNEIYIHTTTYPHLAFLRK